MINMVGIDMKDYEREDGAYSSGYGADVFHTMKPGRLDRAIVKNGILMCRCEGTISDIRECIRRSIGSIDGTDDLSDPIKNIYHKSESDYIENSDHLFHEAGNIIVQAMDDCSHNGLGRIVELLLEVNIHDLDNGRIPPVRKGSLGHRKK